MAPQLALQEILGVINDANRKNRQAERRTNGKEKGIGESLLKVIRLLVEMNPEERNALIELLKILGDKV
jgi:hypothetical protein